MNSSAKDIMALDYFLDSLADPDLVLKIREREPSTLDDALKIALRLEAWSRASEGRDAATTRAVRSVHSVESSPDLWTKLRHLTQQVEELATQLTKRQECHQENEQSRCANVESLRSSVDELRLSCRSVLAEHKQKKRRITCWKCGASGHIRSNCRLRKNAEENDWRVASVQLSSKYPSPPDVADTLAGETPRDAQLADEEIRQVAIHLLYAGEEPDAAEMSKGSKKILDQLHRLTVSNGVVCREFRGRNGRHVLQSLVPLKLREVVAKCCHNGLNGAHLGIKKTLDQVQQRYFWPTWKTDVAKYCRQCSECKRSSRFRRRKHTNVARPHFVDVLQSGQAETVVEPICASVAPIPVSSKPDSDESSVDSHAETSKIRCDEQPSAAVEDAAAEGNDQPCSPTPALEQQLTTDYSSDQNPNDLRSSKRNLRSGGRTHQTGRCMVLRFRD